MIYIQLFFSFLKIGLFSVGGGYAAIPLIQSEIVNGHGWLSMQEFTNLITISSMTPGPVAINSATFVGLRIAGLPGAVTATLGSIFPAVILVSLLSLIYRKYKGTTAIDTVLGCLRPAVVALITAAGFLLARPHCGESFLCLSLLLTGSTPCFSLEPFSFSESGSGIPFLLCAFVGQAVLFLFWPVSFSDISYFLNKTTSRNQNKTG